MQVDDLAMFSFPCVLAGSRRKTLASRKLSASVRASPSPALSVSDSSTPVEDSTTNVGTSGSSDIGVPLPTPDVQGDQGATPDVINVDNLEEEDNDEDEEQAQLTSKRRKRCTSEVWKYFTKKIEIVEVNGQKYEQLWGYCKFPKCKQRYRTEGHHGTTGFKNHLKSQHRIVKG
jgi:hypothetical protein